MDQGTHRESDEVDQLAKQHGLSPTATEAIRTLVEARQGGAPKRAPAPHPVSNGVRACVAAVALVLGGGGTAYTGKQVADTMVETPKDLLKSSGADLVETSALAMEIASSTLNFFSAYQNEVTSLGWGPLDAIQDVYQLSQRLVDIGQRVEESAQQNSPIGEPDLQRLLDHIEKTLDALSDTLKDNKSTEVKTSWARLETSMRRMIVILKKFADAKDHPMATIGAAAWRRFHAEMLQAEETLNGARITSSPALGSQE